MKKIFRFLGYVVGYIFGRNSERHSFTKDIIWYCEICGRQRLDRYISVITYPFHRTMVGIRGHRNLRYCNDNNDCRNKALKSAGILIDNAGV